MRAANPDHKTLLQRIMFDLLIELEQTGATYGELRAQW